MDFDSNKDTITIPELNSFCRILGISYPSCCYQKSRRGNHLYIILPEKYERAELIALQLILGDDRMRGALNLMRVRAIEKNGGIDDFWAQRHNILYRGKVTQ